MKVVNLARRPFVNARPVVRLSGVLWILGLLLLVANFLFYSRYWRDSAEIRGQLAAVEEEMRHEEERLAELDQQVIGLDLEEQTDQVIYLNQLIQNRTFPWSELFEDLEEVLPLDVRLSSVQPSVRFDEQMPKRQASSRSSTSRSRRASMRERTRPPRRPAAGPEEIGLQLPGFAKSDQALMEFVDALYASPSFQRPILRGETRDAQKGGVVFSIEVAYLTRIGDEADAAPDSAAIDQESPGEPGAPETVVADEGLGTQEEPTRTETAAGPSPRDEGERPEVLVATPGADREDLLSRDSQSEGFEPEDRGETTRSSRARARLEAIDDASEGPEEIRSGSRPPARTQIQTGAGYRPPPQTGAGYRPPPQTGAGYRPPPRIQPQDRSPDPTPSGPTSIERDSGGDDRTQPVRPSFVQPSATGTPRLRQGGLLPGSWLVKEIRT